MSGPLDLRVTPATLADLDDIVAIENAAFSFPWPRAAFVAELTANHFSQTFIATSGSDPVGYATVWHLPPEFQLQKLAVLPTCRRRGVARFILTHLAQAVANTGGGKITLELRESNEAALCLYRTLGFDEDGVRRRYYSDTDEDAILMSREVLP